MSILIFVDVVALRIGIIILSVFIPRRRARVALVAAQLQWRLTRYSLWTKDMLTYILCVAQRCSYLEGEFANHPASWVEPFLHPSLPYRASA